MIVDNTSSDVANLYAGWLKRGVHVVTPNKANSGDSVRFESIKTATKQGNAKWLYGAP